LTVFSGIPMTASHAERSAEVNRRLRSAVEGTPPRQIAHEGLL
jgi:hypothetical protein